MLDIRERGTAEAKDTPGSAVLWLCQNEIGPSEGLRLVGGHLELQLPLTAPLAWPTAPGSAVLCCAEDMLRNTSLSLNY